MDSNPIHHPSPAKNMKCSFLDYIQLLIISRAGQWTRTPSTTPLQPIKWNAHFWIMFNFWWSARLVNGLEPHLPPLSSQKNEMLLFGLCSLLMISQAGWWTRTPFTTPLQPIKWNAHFWIAFTLDDWPGWSMDSNPIHHPSPAKRMKCSFLDYVELLMISQAGQWNRTPSASFLQPKKMKCYFLDYVQLLMISWACQWTWTPSTTCLQPIKWNASFWIMFTTDDQPGWSMDSNPICHPSPAKKIKCPYFDYVHLLMTGRAGQWTRKKMKCSSLDYVHFWWSAWLIDELEPHLPPLSYQKTEMLNFQLRSTSDDRPDWLMDSNPICHPSPAKNMKCSILYYI